MKKKYKNHKTIRMRFAKEKFGVFLSLPQTYVFGKLINWNKNLQKIGNELFILKTDFRN